MKKAVWVVLAILVLGAVFVWAFDPFKPQPEPETQPVISDTEYDINSDFYYAQDPNPLGEYSNISECTGLVDPEKTDCVIQAAVKQQNAGYCDSLNQEKVEWCKKDVVVAQGASSGCEALPTKEVKNQCFFDFGYQTDNGDACQNISDRQWADECLRYIAQHTRDTASCELIFYPDFKDDCFLNVAVDSQNISLCERILDSETKQDCKLAFVPAPLPGNLE